ncbi:hypothetical protein [Roseivirga sp.]|uniref:hypothetical protein n=1 Tax=Roseivirga sp. TaxID=1964215 RepID=UPI003B51A14C
MDNTQKKYDSIEKEYFHLQSVIESFDSKSLTIKAWSVSIAGAIAGSSAFTDNRMIILFASLVSLMFWLIEASWKTFQYAHYKRLWEIEAFMREKGGSIDNLQIGASWSSSYHSGGLKRLFRVMFWHHVMLPHGAMFSLLLLVYILLQYIL